MIAGIPDPIQVGRTWVFPDGRTLPVISGAQDDSLPTETAPPPEPTTSDDGFDPGEGDAFTAPGGDKVYTESYVKRLREEAAKHRVEAKSVKERYSAFDGMDDADLGWFVDAASAYRTGGVDALVSSHLKPLMDSLVAEGATPQEAAEVAQEAADLAEEKGKALSEKDIERLLDEKLSARTKAEEQAAVARQIDATLAEAGYKKGSVEYITVLTYATENRLTIDRAIADMEAAKQAIIDEYVQGKKSAPRTVTGGAGEEDPPTPRNTKEAAKMADEWLARQRAAAAL